MGKIHGIVEKMAMYEESMMRLYAAFRDVFSEDKKFWDDISEEEKQHAYLLREFGKMVSDGDVELAFGHISEAVVDKSIAYIGEEIKKVKNHGMNITQAFELARTLECGILESESFSVFETRVPDMKMLFDRINDDTKRHYQILTLKCGGSE